MRFERDDGREELYRDFRRFGEEALSRDVAERDKAGLFGHDDWARCAERGVLGLVLPSEYGGAGRDLGDYVSAMEGLGHGCLDNGLLMAMGAHVLAVELPVWKFGDEGQRRKYLPGLAAGRLIGANAMTEPASGSDALSLATTAERDGGFYRLNGRKRYVTNAPVADVFVVYATVDAELGFTGVTAFLVEGGDDGVSVKERPEKMGLRTARWGEVELDDCRIPASRRLGAERQGAAIFARSMAWERALLLAPWLGVMRREIDECTRFCRRRRQFGKHIGHFQSISNRIVDMRIRWEVSRMLLHRAAAELDRPDATIIPEAGKLYVSEAAAELFGSAMQVYGALGYTSDGRAERNLRDALGMTISSGTSDMQRVIISGKLGITWPDTEGSGEGR
ncbi:acyl-CoA dehydrogenase family protein [Actinomadura algeriensis]|uniref:Alkylation response protein AidB-like acyl-CoA dehydrogenase n=1 Tax=Actinomadura algeriensis TaxID=1679523 RepID=A0ABR9K1P8_9ACTN|nr:acyl-CoA dehydrogenase family protein [Actinomadura algeriensis]MBE1536764.1 alkylation response protein AidB-like acyl-CoA dehydrogenase [Actinomadura algeriensis]